MNFNFESQYIEDESEDFPFSVYEIHGVRKIKELSQQLQTLQNFRVATLQYRFRPKTSMYPEKKGEKYRIAKRNFKKTSSKFLKIIGENVSNESKLKRFLEKSILSKEKKYFSFLSSLKDVTEEFFTWLHRLAELEIHLHPKQLKSVVKLAMDAFIVSGILKCWASKFYEELRLNYLLVLLKTQSY